MAKQTIGIGTTANDTTGDKLRTAFTKVNANFTELYNGYATANSAVKLANNSYILYIDSYGNTHLPSHVIFHTVPATSRGAAGDQVGEMTTDGIYLYICNATYTNGVADIWSRTNLNTGAWP
jgi:hypothetical protein